MTTPRRFITGFLIALLVFLGLNLLAAHSMSDCGLAALFQLDSCADDITRAGWPVKFYEAGGFAYHREFNALASGLDLGIGLVMSAGLRWLFARRTKRATC